MTGHISADRFNVLLAQTTPLATYLGISAPDLQTCKLTCAREAKDFYVGVGVVAVTAMCFAYYFEFEKA